MTIARVSNSILLYYTKELKTMKESEKWIFNKREMPFNNFILMFHFVYRILVCGLIGNSNQKLIKECINCGLCLTLIVALFISVRPK